MIDNVNLLGLLYRHNLDFNELEFSALISQSKYCC